jgi:hypothetical protein
MNIYYFANQIYQYSYALPIYRKAGGTFIAKSIKRIIQFKRYLKDGNSSTEVKTFLNSPPLLKCTTKNVQKLEGVVISFSNAAIHSGDKKCKTIFVGHGTGDKPYGPNVQLLEGYDYHFISGPKHLEKLKDVGLKIPEEKLIKIGNPRFDDYINGKIDRDCELNRLGVIDKTRKNVLYAPTWKWGDGTLHKYVYHFAREITKEYNLIVRPHSHDRKYIPKLKRWMGRNGIEHVYFSNPADLVKCDTMNDFMVSDILISDTSSILYEYLIADKPIIVAKNEYKELHHMPNEMDITNFVTIYDGSQHILKLIADNLADHNYKSEYQKLLNNCFYFNDGKSVERAANFIHSISE